VNNLKDAIFILVHNKFDQARELIKRLQIEFDVFIHIDKKSETPVDFIKLSHDYTNVHFCKNNSIDD
jgi:hypothetical protein